MADTRGTWSLSEAWAEKSAAEWVPIPGVWVTPAVTKVDTGYIAGGNPAQNVDKLNFSNDTKTGLGYIPLNAYRKSGGIGGFLHGYFGGRNPGYIHDVDKLVYATDTSSHLPGTNLSAGRGYLAGCNSETYGYFVGGAGSFNTYVSIVDRITHATDSIERLPSADLPSANKKQSLMATTAHPSAAYIAGGVSPATTAVSKLTFSTEASAQVPGAAMATARGYATCTSNGTNTYWYAGGTNNNGSVTTSDIDKTVFASDTTAVIPANMDTGFHTRAAAAGASTFGVIAGGYHPGPTTTNAAHKFTYSSETRAVAPGYYLTNGKKEAAGISARNGFTETTYDGDITRWLDNKTEPPNTSYGTAGNNGPSPVYKLDFTTMTAHGYMPGATQSPQRDKQGTFSSSDAGYMSGGTTWIPGSYAIHNIDKLPYATETTARLPSSNLSGYLWLHAGISDGTTQGWFWGGNNGGSTYNNTTITKITFSTDAASTAPSPMTAGNYNLKSTNSATAGYSFGGVTYSTNSQKLVFSTETTSMLTSLTPSHINAYGSATGDQTAGYVSAGHPAYSMIAKTTWATETSDNMPSSGCLSNARKNTFCMGNSTNGFWAGGSPGSNGTIDNLTYATDTLANVPSWEPNAMAGGVYNGWGVGARNAGIPVVFPPTATPTSTSSGPEEKAYILGGNPGPLSLVDKLTMSTETFSNVAYSSQNNKRQGGHGNLENGYFSGKASPVGSSTEKLVYSTETRTTIPANLPATRSYCKGISNNTIGYVGPGGGGTTAKTITKMTYSTEAFSSVPNMDVNRTTRYATFGNQTQAYWAVGSGAPDPHYYWSTISKTTYSNDSTATVPGYAYSGRAPSPAGRGVSFAFAASNGTLGYLCGGEQSPGATVVDKITMASDTGSRVPSADLVAHRYSIQGMNSSSKAYFTGGSPGNRSNTQVLTFSTDTTALSSTGNVSTPGRSGYGAAGPNQRGNDPTPNVI